MECKRILYKYLTQGIKDKPILLYVNYQDVRDLSYIDRLLTRMQFDKINTNEFCKVIV